MELSMVVFAVALLVLIAVVFLLLEERRRSLNTFISKNDKV